MSEKICCLNYDGGYRKTSNKSHGFSSRKSSGFTHIGFDPTRIDRYKVPCVAGLNSQTSRYFQWQPSALVSQILLPSYSSHMFNSFYVKKRILASPHVSRNTLIYVHMDSPTLLTCWISLDWLVLSVGEFWHLVEFTQMYWNWGYIFRRKAS
jgi:hypothetical protein